MSDRSAPARARGSGSVLRAEAFAARVEAIVIEGWFADPPPFLRAMAIAPTVAVAFVGAVVVWDARMVA
jgi:hypothetical protein